MTSPYPTKVRFSSEAHTFQMSSLRTYIWNVTTNHWDQTTTFTPTSTDQTFPAVVVTNGNGTTSSYVSSSGLIKVKLEFFKPPVQSFGVGKAYIDLFEIGVR